MKLRNLFYITFPLLLCVYLFYYIPVFLNKQNYMYFFEPAPRFNPIGIDLRWLHSIIMEWSENKFIYKPGLTLHFPPLILIIFIWASACSFNTLYQIYVPFCFSLYFITCIMFLLFLKKKHQYSEQSLLIAMPFILLGYFSYGVQFEIERGQWNLLAFSLVLLGIILLQKNLKMCKYFAYSLLFVATQIKLWPLVYILPFVRLETSTSNAIRKTFSFFVLNLAFLFIFGKRGAENFISQLHEFAAASKYGVAQTSFTSFLWCLKKENLFFEKPICYVALFCFVLIAMFAFHITFFGKKYNFEVLIFLCTLLSLLIPSQSNDYKLCLLPISLVIMIPYFYTIISKNSLCNILISLIVFFITFTYFSFTLRPDIWFLQNTVACLLLAGLSACFLHLCANRINLHSSNNNI